MKHLISIFLVFLLSISFILCSLEKSKSFSQESSKLKINSKSGSTAGIKIKSNTSTKLIEALSTKISSKLDANFKSKINSMNVSKTNLNSNFRTKSKYSNNANFFTLSKLRNEKSFFKKQPSSLLGKELQDQTTYYEGWVNYYHYNNHITNKRPKKFFKNNYYFSQRVSLNDVNKMDCKGKLIIPSKSSFFLVVSKNALHLFNSRGYAFKTQNDSLEIKYIKSIPEDNYLKGGLKDLGSFSIGHCFEIKAEIKSLKQTWVFCLNHQKEKTKLFKIILKLKLKYQRKKGELKTENSIKNQKYQKNTISAFLSSTKNKDNSRPNNENLLVSPIDGYWILLQDWSECTLKCGGGESYQQWQCIEPKNGGKPCQGKSIRVKKCNIQPCPNLNSVLEFVKKTGYEVKKPIIKVAPFSSRPQRYDKCVIKDNDAYLMEYEPNKKKIETRLPIRIVMNNITVTLFKDDDYTDISHSFELDNSELIELKDHFCCFTIRDFKASANICGYDKYCGNQINNKFVKEWTNHFSLFKSACKVGRQETLLSIEDEKIISQKLKKKLGEAKLEVMGKKQKEIREKYLSAGTILYKKALSQAHDIGIKEIQKEIQLENLIKNEEKQREEEEIASIIKKIEEEKDKAACLKRNINEKKLDAQIIHEKKTTEKEIKEFQNEMHNQVNIKREKMKKLIENMRLKARLRKATLEAELNSLKHKMAEEMIKENKLGDINKCHRGKNERNFRENYCDLNFIDDFIRNSDCKTDENFCYMCCENEFGDMHIDQREKCYNMCDDTENKKITEKKKGRGTWVWNQK